MIVVIGCGDAKGPGRAPACQLYTGSLFRSHLRLARQIEPRAIFVVSALHILVEIDKELDRYDHKISDLSEADREAWARQVAEAVEAVAMPRELVIVLAGAEYTAWCDHVRRRTTILFAGCTMLERRKLAARLCDTRRKL